MRRNGHEVAFSTRTKDEEKAKREAARILRLKQGEWGVRDDLEDATEEAADRIIPPPQPRETPRLARPHVDGLVLKNKLRALGGAAPVTAAGEASAAGTAPPPAASSPPPAGAPGSPENPEVLTPSQAAEEKAKADSEQKEKLDDEASELFADMLGGAIVGGHQRLVKNACANMDPPKRAADPNELMLEWERAGIQKRLRKMMGKAGGLSENAKLVIGMVGVTVSMVWNAEEVPQDRRAPAPPPEKPAQAQQPGPPAPPPAPKPPEPAQPMRAPLALVPEAPPPANDEAAAGRFK